MGPDFDPIAGAEGWQQSNPSVLSMAALRASLEIFDEATIERLREKSISLTGYLEFLLDANASDRFTILTPRDASQRGAQLSIRIASGRRSICDRLIANGVLCDWREPDILRIAPAPLYNSYQDVHQCVQKFLALLD
jgi:kynureninase